MLAKEILNKIYEYDVIIPKSHRANEVWYVIENETERMSTSQHKELKNEDVDEEQIDELHDIINGIDENEPIIENKSRLRGKEIFI